MDENEFRSALRTTVTLHPEPPPMQSRTAVAVARRAVARRNLLAGGGAAAAILAVTVAVVPAFGGGTNIQPAAGPSAGLVPFPPSQPVPAVSETKPSWPAEASGDATADSGAHYNTGKALLADVLKVVPAGYTVPSGTVGDGIPLRDHQATVEDDYWRYMATVALRQGDRTGGLVVEVHEPGNKLPTDVCKLAQEFWGRGGTCVPQTVGGEKVGVVRDGTGTAWAAYRHADGTVVYVRQSTSTTYGSEVGFQPLPTLPLTVTELATLATDNRFRL
ncbi:hypothetical protein [Actinoplanes derwentensis]|uniref:Uncharacterized protein n=1 Tax=Actinoplanes derwentensis TaxID=113562 RepID=A0A1H1PJ93_9ACTN|nr:hypothetical protein [Actinoplanes derwentensis]GID84912.1 hypothetical protein Ade03nite_38360 [Actinoplanes derwentensis]SDS11115.1 hypothetical protein SAMN04489716_0033 [Actinoplanes derwentensis]